MVVSDEEKGGRKMLIRSQDKESLIAIDGNFVEILKYGDLSECSITVSTRDHSSLHVMARYSSTEKAIKVLDMIQEAYERYEYEKTFKTGLTLFETFQMPADSEVET